MSITKDFEQAHHPLHVFGDSFWYPKKSVDALLAHARALEAMLKELEWSGEWRDMGASGVSCPVCFTYEEGRHGLDCQLAKLLDGVDG